MSVSWKVVKVGGHRVCWTGRVTIKLSGAGRGRRVGGINWSEEVIGRGGGGGDRYGRGEGDVDVFVVPWRSHPWVESVRWRTHLHIKSFL